MKHAIVFGEVKLLAGACAGHGRARAKALEASCVITEDEPRSLPSDKDPSANSCSARVRAAGSSSWPRDGSGG